MNLTYNSFALESLGPLRVTAQSGEYTPNDDAPQRLKITLRVELHFFQQDFAGNRALVNAALDALKTQHGLLTWTDDAGAAHTNQTATLVSHDLPEDPNAWGSYHQAVTFTFTYWRHDLTTNTLTATFTKTGGAALTLSNVFTFKHGLETTRLNPRRAPRAQTARRLALSGEFLGNPNATLEARRQTLLDLAAQWVAQMNTADGTLVYGGVSYAVRVDNFEAEVNQASNAIPWSLSCSFNDFGEDETMSTFELDTRLDEGGRTTVGFTGTISAPTLAVAQAKLTGLRAAWIPSTHLKLQLGETHRRLDADTDGGEFIELTFSDSYRQPNATAATYTADGQGALTLGDVLNWTEGMSQQRYSTLRSQRSNCAGRVEVSGHVPAPSGLSESQRRDYLRTKADQLRAAFNTKDGVLVYGGFSQRVRIEDFRVNIAQSTHVAEWSCSASYTLFPNETGYALAEFSVRTGENRENGQVTVSLAGKILAESAVAAQTKLTAIRAAYAPTGAYTRMSNDNSEARIDGEDGASFIELTFDETWRKRVGDLLEWNLRISDSDDATSGQLRTSYNGFVIARGADYASAYAAALAQARTLADGKYQFRLSREETPEDRQTLVSGERLVRLDFTYTYRRKGSRVYAEVSTETNTDAFGSNSIGVSGYVVALDATAAGAVVDQFKAVYAGSQIRSERRSTARVEIGETTANARTQQFTRLEFSFSVFVAKTTNEVAVRYELETQKDFRTLAQTTELSGTIWSKSAASARTALATFIGTLALGSPVRERLQESHENYLGNPASTADDRNAFQALTFSYSFEGKLAGGSAVLECQLSEQVRHSGTRWVAQPTAAGRDVIQNCGILSGRRSLRGRVIGPTEAVCRAWMNTQRALLDGTYEEPPEVDTGFVFVPLTVGVARGGGANFQMIELGFTFSELLPDEDYVA